MEEWINQSLTAGLVVIFGSLFKEELLQTKKKCKKENRKTKKKLVWRSSSLNKERNITTKPVVKCLVYPLFCLLYHIYIYIYIYISSGYIWIVSE